MNLENDQLKIDVKYSIVAPSDVIRAGGTPKDGKSGDVFAGIVKSIGKDIKKFKVGDQVFGTIAPKTGTHKDSVLVKTNSVTTQIPKNISLKESASLVDGPLTAYAFLKKHAKLKSGQNILVNGASGSVGLAAVQIAKLLGANVTGVCSDKNIKLVKTIGADKVIDYNKQTLSDLPNRFDIIFDTVNKSSFSKTKHLLTKRGIYMTTGPSLGIIKDYVLTRFTKKKAIMAATGLFWKQNELEEIKAMIENGKLKPVIDRTYKLEELKKAYEYVKLGHKVGSVIIEVN